MLWKKWKQCIVCGFYSRQGEMIHKSFWCTPCEKQMVEDQCREYDERERGEIERISNQVVYNDHRIA